MRPTALMIVHVLEEMPQQIGGVQDFRI